MSFPNNFVWGAAAAAYQIEGAAREDGKGLSVWDVFAHWPGKVWNGHTGDIATDHYHRFKDDVALMKAMGLHAYRLSISWPRVLPGGVGKVNEAGLDYYNNLVDALLAADITPYVTLFHWDFPYELYCRGSWLNRDSADWFADYASLIVGALGDRVKHWMTLNEPAVFVNLGYGNGIHAPGDQLSTFHLLRIAHHVLLAHGKAVQAIRATAKGECHVGVAPDISPLLPASDDATLVDIVRREQFTTRSMWSPGLWYDPLLLGKYPDDMNACFGDDLPAIQADDLKTIHQPLDFLGVNIYRGEYLRLDASGKPERVPPPMGEPLTSFEWRITPEALYWGPKWLYERYKLPLYITENGLANPDWVAVDGHVHDPQRIDFMTRYLRNFEKAGEAGVDIRGYFHWSIMDNFEWAEGMKQRFGLIHVDYQTQKRTMKDSAYWYRDVIRSNGATLHQTAAVAAPSTGS
jgi:beta-glucosidase